jgi:hypothetical protein
LEYLAFGDTGLWGFQIVHWASHLAASVAVFLFLRYLVGQRLALTASVIWVMSLPGLLFLPQVNAAVGCWKDSLEPWFTLPAVGFLACAVYYLRTENRRALAGAFVFFVLAVLVKESAYPLPVLLAVLAVYEGKAKRLRDFAGLIPVAIGLLAWRSHVLHGVTASFGSNHAWFVRFLINGGGGATVMPIVSGDFLALAIASLTVAVAQVFLFHETRELATKWVWPLAFAAVAVGSCLLTDLLQKSGWGDAFLRATVVLPWHAAAPFHNAIQILWLGGLWYYCLRYRDRTQLLGLAWFFVLYLPLLATPTGEHALYFASLGWCLWLAVPLLAASDRCWMLIKSCPWRSLDNPRYTIAPQREGSIEHGQVSTGSAVE